MKPQEAPPVETRFVRSTLCRVIHADSAWGGPTYQGNIHMALYSEYVALPDGTTISVNEQGKPEEKSAGGGTVIREIEADVILSLMGAIAIRDWLSARIIDLQGIQAQIQEMQAQAQPQA